jgi:hypothetical protein
MPRFPTSRFHQEDEKFGEVQSIVEEMLAARRQMYYGEVVAYDPTLHSVKVKLLPEMGHLPHSGPAITGYIPMASGWGGNGWGIKGGIVENRAQVIVFKMGWPVSAMFAIGPFYNETNRPPAGDKGEITVTHKTGTRVKLLNDGTVELVQPSTGSHVILSGGTLEIKTSADVNVTATGNATVTAAAVDITATGLIQMKGGG